MEHMSDVLLFRGAVALAVSFHTPLSQQVAHGQGVIPEEIIVGGEQVGGRIVGTNGVQHIQSGVGQIEFSAQIVQRKACHPLAHHGTQIIHAAV